MGEAAGGESINVLRTTIVKKRPSKTENLKTNRVSPSFKFKVTKTFKNDNMKKGLYPKTE